MRSHGPLDFHRESLPRAVHTEPANLDPDTLANLGPLRGLAGIWEGAKGGAVHLFASGGEEQATGMVIQTLAIPRAQIAMAMGKASADATRFEQAATRSTTTSSICSGPFLEHDLETIEYRIHVTVRGAVAPPYPPESTIARSRSG